MDHLFAELRRREFLIGGVSVVLAASVETAVLEVAYAGSVGSMMEGPIGGARCAYGNGYRL